MHSLLSTFKAHQNHIPPSPIPKENQISSPNVKPLTVIELFQSQGCSSCPPANHHLLKLLHDPAVLILTYNVTYWDYLGWKDTFGNSAFDRRQRAYSRSLGLKNVFTPQVIVNGRISGVGATQSDLQSLIQAAKPVDNIDGGSNHKDNPSPLPQPVEITYDIHTKAIHVSGLAVYQSNIIVNLIHYDPSKTDVPIARGENSGCTLPHGNVVRRVVSLGEWHGGEQEFFLPHYLHDEDVAGLNTAVLVQAGEAGAILGAARL